MTALVAVLLVAGGVLSVYGIARSTGDVEDLGRLVAGWRGRR